MSFVHLQVHSEYSLQDSLVRVGELIDCVDQANMPAVALSDVDNLFAFVKFYQSCLAKAIKPICAVELTVNVSKHSGRVILIAKNYKGYQALLRLTSMRYSDHPRGVPIDKYKTLCDNLIAIISPWQGITSNLLSDGKFELAEQVLSQLNSLFPKRFYLGLIRHKSQQHTQCDSFHMTMCKKFAIAPVALGAVCFLKSEEFEAHEVRVCINSGRLLNDRSRPKNYTPEQAFASEEQMRARFHDIPAAIENAVRIAQSANVELELDKVFLPEVSPPSGTLEDYFRHMVQSCFDDRCVNNQPLDEYQQRLDTECDIIIQMGFMSYFLIVADFIAWAKSQKIPVGPGRGSGAGSLVAYVLGITDIDPIKYGLLFERFLNPERVSMPDFDIDFCMEKRDAVIQYVTGKYGANAVSQIITYGTMAAKAVIRDVGRVLGQPYGFMDKLAKLIPFEIGMTLEKAMEKEQELARLYKQDETVKNIMNLSLQLEGLVRNVGRHAGGVVIAPGDLTNFTALYQESEDLAQPVTQYDKDDIEKIGLVKFDFLGLRTLTIIDWACQTLREINVDLSQFTIEQIPLNDSKTFNLLQGCNTTGVFQLESRGMKELISRLSPDCFEDIIALVALYRPGPLQSGMVDDFIDRKHGRSSIKYPHDSLEEILKPTYGVILYQEQVMQIAQVLSGYTLGNADLLRRAMGKKKVKEMEAQRAIFIEGAKKQSVSEKQSSGIFDLVEKFAGYGFNKSHSAAYALITYQTAWLKANYPDALMSAVLSSDMDNTDKVVGFYEDTLKQGITILPVCINRSYCKFKVESPMTIRYGMGAVKGVGEGFAIAVVSEREKNGPYKDILDFCMRIQDMRVNRKMLESLIKCGAFDTVFKERSVLFASIERIIAQRDQKIKDKGNHQGDLLGQVTQQVNHWQVDVPAWPMAEQLAYEREVMGLYLSSHPMCIYREEVKSLGAATIEDLKSASKRRLIAAVLLSHRVVYTKTGRRFVIVIIEDENNKEEILLSDQEYQRAEADLQSGQVFLFDVNIQTRHDGNRRLSCDRIWTIAQRRETSQGHLLLSVDHQAYLDIALDLEVLFSKQQSGNCQITLNIVDQHNRTKIPCNYQIKMNDELLEMLEQIKGVTYQMSYQNHPN
tara:strand:- start:8502 stop:11891 length:3390 start_codon:yes stop_codon:yes gene_type:complete